MGLPSESSQKNNYSGDTKKAKFIEKAREIHGDKYTYDKTIYVASNAKVIITCPFHGDFNQTPNKHISAQTGCPMCAAEKNKHRQQQMRNQNLVELIQKIHITHPDLKASIRTYNALDIWCPLHGYSVFQYRPGNLNKYPCKRCGIEENRKQNTQSDDQYISNAKLVHGGKYDYISQAGKLYAICQEHGRFALTGNRRANHIARKSGCPQCKKDAVAAKLKTPRRDFIKKANDVHGGKYNYEGAVYVNTHTKVSIECNIHGTFQQTPLNHLHGAGCPKCKSSKAETTFLKILQDKSVDVVTQKTFDDCTNPETNRKLKYDFYLPEYNLLVELDGEQHFEPVSFSHSVDGVAALLQTRMRDDLKNQYAFRNNIPLLRIPFTDFDILDDIVNEIVTAFG